MTRRWPKLLAVAAVCFALPARAERPEWLRVSAPLECRTSAEVLAKRVHDGIAGERNPELAAAVTITRAGASYRVLVSVGSELAREAVTAANCTEAEDAAVAILTLALGVPLLKSEMATATASGSGARDAEHEEPSREQRTESFVAAFTAPVRDRTDASTRRSQPERSRVALGAGVDAGTLPEPTAYLGAAWTQSLGSLELVGQARYGLPVIEEADGIARENLRQEFGVVGLLACYGTGAALHLAACAGAELGVVRTLRTLETAQLESATDIVEPRVAGLLGMVAAFRRGPVEPRLEAEAALAALGRESAAPVVVLRAGAGAAVRF